jgi:chromosome segregation ATPase
LKSRINSLEKENEKIEILMEDISILTEEKAGLEKVLSEVSFKIDKVNEYETRQQELECKLNDLEPELEQSREYAATLEETNMVMTAKLSELENKTKNMEVSNVQIDKLCQELKNQLEAEKTKNEKQIMYLEMSKQKITSLEETVKESMTELEEQRKISDRSEQELQLEKAKASSNKINGFKEELDSIYRKIEVLEDEAAQHVQNINELQHQLSLEQIRANKAENNLSAYSRLVSDFKDKFEKEQNMLEAQYRNFLNNRSQLHSEISDLVEINIM